MTIPELPAPTLETNGDVFGHENEQGYSADQMRAYGEACYRAGLERAAQIADAPTITPHFKDDEAAAQMMTTLIADYLGNVAAAIRAEAAKEAK